jgi:uncharacterized repeat protein (TIGR03803 family)
MLQVRSDLKFSDSANARRTRVGAFARTATIALAVVAVGAASLVPSTAAVRRFVPAGRVESLLIAFLGGNGAFPFSDLAAVGTTVYATTSDGGLVNSRVWKSSGKFVGYGVFFTAMPGKGGYVQTYFYPFKNGPSDGATPNAGVILDAAGDAFGTTTLGGSANLGSVFRFVPNPSGFTESLIYSFLGKKSSDGAHPYASLLIDSAGNLYGTTAGGGSAACSGGCGTVFKLTLGKNGKYTETVLHAFTATKDGHNPYAGLIADSTGALYGTTEFGGKSKFGTVFKLTPSGTTYTESVIYNFAGGADGALPMAALTAGNNGVMYGTTYNGGNAACTGGCGTAFALTPGQGGTYSESVIYAFMGGTDGYFPRAKLLNVKGALYGTTYYGGTSSNCTGTGCGTVFKLTPSKGSFTESIVYAFQGAFDGEQPTAGVLQSGAKLFGMTYAGGGSNCFEDRGPCGTLYSVHL